MTELDERSLAPSDPGTPDTRQALPWANLPGDRSRVRLAEGWSVRWLSSQLDPLVPAEGRGALRYNVCM